MPQYTEPEEKKLVSAVMRGDKEAFKQLIQTYERLVAAIVFRMITGEQDREDLCQEVLLKVYEKIASFRFASKLSTWIGRIAFNTCINFLKRKRPLLLQDLYTDEEEKTPGTLLQASDSIKADEPLLKKERQAALQRSIEHLPPLQKTVLQLFHYEDLSLEEIVTVTGLPMNTVKSHLFRARRNLKDQLKNLMH